MKYFFCVFAIIVMTVMIDAEDVAPPGTTPPDTTPTGTTPPDTTPPGTPGTINDPLIELRPNCDCKNRVPLYRLYNPKTGDHFYTTNKAEATTAVISLGYKMEVSPGYVLPATAYCVCSDQYVPVYRLSRNKPSYIKDHFYTTSVAEASTAAQQYKWEGIAYYCAIKPNCDCGPMKALHRYYVKYDHFYTTNLDEAFANVIPNGGKYEGILCYIWV